MGISGLLPLLKSIQQQKHLSDLSGKTIAVDGYVWLHKGAYGCAVELVNGKPTTKFVDYAMHRIRLLRHHGIEPYVIFDGGPLPAKQGTEGERRRKRSEALEKAKHLASIGRHSEARELFVKCIDISPRHAYQLIKALKAESVQYIVAPYEADAQLAYLEQTGLVDGILTEDSDLLVFGCQNVYYKLDPGTSTLTSIARSNFPKVKDINLTLWTDKEFRHMAMLSGCDYLEGLKGVGVRTANKLLRKYKHLEGVLKHVALENGSVRVPKGYKEAFEKAELAFLWQRVWDPVSKKLVHLGGTPEEEWSDEKDAFVGRMLEDDLAQQIATGDVCPISYQPIPDINPRFQPRSRTSSATTSTSGAAKPPPTLSGPMDRFLSAKSKTKKSPLRHRETLSVKSVAKSTVVVKGSGMRTLAGEQERIQALKTKKTSNAQSNSTKNSISSSRFFGLKTAERNPPSKASNSGRPGGPGVETTIILVDDDENVEIEELTVEQEDGYRSPSPSFAEIRASSPVFVPSPTKQNKSATVTDDDDGWEDEEVLSSPVKPRMEQREVARKSMTKGASVIASAKGDFAIKASTLAKVEKEVISLVSPTPSPVRPSKGPEHTLAPDLSTFFESFETVGDSQEGSSGIPLSERSSDDALALNISDDTDGKAVGDFVTSPASPIGSSVPESDFDAVAESDLDDTRDEEGKWKVDDEQRLQTVAKGWRARYSLGSITSHTKLVRRETLLSPIAQRRNAPESTIKSRPEEAGLPLQPIEFNIKARSTHKSLSSPILKPHHPSPQPSKQTVPPRRSFSSIQQSEENGLSDEDLDTRATKRRRVSMPGEEAIERTARGPLDADTIVARSRGRLAAFRFGA